jgi:hypothetical protein
MDASTRQYLIDMTNGPWGLIILLPSSHKL